MSAGALPSIAARRRNTDRVMRGLIVLATAIALVPLVLVVYYLLHRGLGAWTGHFFTSDPTGNFFGDQGGIKSALLGTLEIVALASLIAIPLGVAVALYLVEFGKQSKFAATVRYFVDVMTGVPSIVFGLFIYVTLVINHWLGSSNAGWKGSIALGLLMLPVVTRAAEVALVLVPQSLREAALALGVPRYRVVLRIVLPTALPGILTGALLAVARAAGETAPLLFTSSIVKNTSFDLNGPVNSLPVQIFNDLQQPNPALVQRAWGAALALVTLILLTSLIARFVSRKSTIR